MRMSKHRLLSGSLCVALLEFAIISLPAAAQDNRRQRMDIDLPDFSLAATLASQTVTAGQSATTAISVTPANGFNTAVSFACSGLPSGAAWSFSPATVTPSGAAASTTLAVSTSKTTAALRQNARPLFPAAALAAL